MFPFQAFKGFVQINFDKLIDWLFNVKRTV